MANPEHVEVLRRGVKEWNRWRDQGHNLSIQPDLSGVEFSPEDYFAEVNFCRTNLRGAKMNGMILAKANLFGADLSDVELNGTLAANADLRLANLQRVKCVGSSLNLANLLEANLTDADLRGTDLKMAILVRSNMQRVVLDDALVWGASVWETDLTGASQSNLVISPESGPVITTDNLEVAQFIYLLLDNQKIRHVIDTITSKVVLILGRFTPERKTILDAIRRELRNRDYLPVLFDFEKPSNRDITETVSALAHMARFVIADITDAKSIPQELMAIVPALPSVPVQPLLLESQSEYGMFEHFRRFPWVLEPFLYHDQDQLLGSLDSHVVGPVEAKAKERSGR